MVSDFSGRSAATQIEMAEHDHHDAVVESEATYNVLLADGTPHESAQDVTLDPKGANSQVTSRKTQPKKSEQTTKATTQAEMCSQEKNDVKKEDNKHNEPNTDNGRGSEDKNASPPAPGSTTSSLSPKTPASPTTTLSPHSPVHWSLGSRTSPSASVG